VPIISRACSSIINLQYSITPNNLPSSAMQKRQNLIGRNIRYKKRPNKGVDIKPNNMQRAIFTLIKITK